MEGGGKAQEGRDIRILVADSHCCMAEANTMFERIILQLKKTHTPKKNPFFSLKSIVFLHLICISILSYLAKSISLLLFFFNFTVWEKSISLVPSNIVA